MALGFSVSSLLLRILAGVGIDNFGHRATFSVAGLLYRPVASSAGLGKSRFPVPWSTRMRRSGHILDLLRDPAMRRLFATMTILTVAWDVYAFAIPVHGSHLGLSASKIGVVMGAFAAAAFAIRLAIPFLWAPDVPWTLLVGALLVGGCQFRGLAFVQRRGNDAVRVLLGTGFGAPQPMMLTLLHESAPRAALPKQWACAPRSSTAAKTVMPVLFGAVGTVVGLKTDLLDDRHCPDSWWGFAAKMAKDPAMNLAAISLSKRVEIGGAALCRARIVAASSRSSSKPNPNGELSPMKRVCCVPIATNWRS